MARISRILMLTALFGAAALVVPGAASAVPATVTAETARNTKTQELTNNPNSGMPESCVERRISLATGTYDWAQIGGLGERSNLNLGQGWYTWKDCLDPGNGSYDHTTWLNPDNPDWETIELHGEWKPEVPGNWQWGSFLDPRF
ncbi:hypothetical protein AB0M05_27310 [Streptomyces violaceusniger]|uniref:hypothetical protein n=1 Tax=Streptomyces violaceusniger TaxID=68280 RepID=UPI0034205297